MSNITIESIANLTGVRGDGELVFGASPIVVPIPAMITEPSNFRRESDRSVGIETTHIIQIVREAFEAQNHIVEIGDRLTYLKNRLDVDEITGDVVAFRELSSGIMLEITLGKRLDGVVIGGA